MSKISFVRSGNKELAIYGDYLRFKDNESIKSVILSKINSILVDGVNNQYSKLLWSCLGFLTSIISWYFLEENLMSNLISIFSFIGGLIFFVSYFILSSYLKMTIKTTSIDIVLEFPSHKKNMFLEFKRTLLDKTSK
ncbi:MAG: hypothetical protein CL893_00290 [Dehalococcoidia bacterium]|nr:hypothetical protein [Dehalococcoidia bacterium]|tara:strand:- start:1052 stop:1462 length:411 start_codon:yes stop_codon:yes gene_type:complete